MAMTEYDKMVIDFKILKKELLKNEYSYFNLILDYSDRLLNEESIDYFLNEHNKTEEVEYCKQFKQDSRIYIRKLTEYLSRDNLFYKLIETFDFYTDDVMLKDYSAEQLVDNLLDSLAMMSIVENFTDKGGDKNAK